MSAGSTVGSLCATHLSVVLVTVLPETGVDLLVEELLLLTEVLNGVFRTVFSGNLADEELTEALVEFTEDFVEFTEDFVEFIEDFVEFTADFVEFTDGLGVLTGLVELGPVLLELIPVLVELLATFGVEVINGLFAELTASLGVLTNALTVELTAVLTAKLMGVVAEESGGSAGLLVGVSLLLRSKPSGLINLMAFLGRIMRCFRFLC